MHDVNGILEGFRSAGRRNDAPDCLLDALKTDLQRSFPHDQYLPSALRLAEEAFDRSSKGETTELRIADEKTEFFVRNIERLRRFAGGDGFALQYGRVRTIDERFDFLSTDFGKWPLFKVLNFALLQTIKPEYSVAVVTTLRDEGIGILEWIAHYRAMGIDEIFVYTNDNSDGSDALLERLAALGLIKLLHNRAAPNVPLQLKVYEHSLHLLPELRKFKWVFYLDADEFLVPRCEPDFHIDSMFAEISARIGSEEPSAICFHWKWFGSHNAFSRTDGLVIERFSHSLHNRHVKSLVKLKDVVTMQSVHCPQLFAGCFSVNSELEILPSMSVEVEPVVYGIGQINHYWNKSFEEFVVKKLRGRASVGTGGPQLDFATFFDWGANGRLGNYDPPPNALLLRTKAAYQAMRQLEGVGECLQEINATFQEKITSADQKLDLRRIFDSRGRAVEA